LKGAERRPSCFKVLSRLRHVVFRRRLLKLTLLSIVTAILKQLVVALNAAS